MADYGITPQGFVAKTFDVIVDDLDAACRSEFGFVPRGLLRVLLRIVAERFQELWELAELSFTVIDPDAVQDALQDALNSLTGTIRNEATPSSTLLTCTGAPATVLDEEAQAQNEATADVFQFEAGLTAGERTIVALDAWATGTPYAVGDRVTNDGHAYVCTVAGTSDITLGPTSTDYDESIADNDVRWRYMGEGTGAIDVPAECVETGPVVAESGDIRSIVTAQSGWSNVLNLLDADVGRDRESNEDFRVRREEELSQAGATTPDAIRAELLELDGVTSVTVFYNPSDSTDGDGVPPHAVECLVRGGDDQEIFDLLLQACIAAGIASHGTEVGASIDSEGTSHPVKFSRPDEIAIYVDIALEVETLTYGGDTAVKTAIVAFGDAQKAGKNAVASSVGAQSFDAGGVLNHDVAIYTDVIGTPAAWAATTGYSATPGARSVVTNNDRKYICITSGTSAGSGGPLGTGTDITDGTVHWRFLGATIPISTRELAVFDTSRIDVTTTPGTP